MISPDTNIFIKAVNDDMPYYHEAHSFLQSHHNDTRFVLCELVLVELYMALRNPSIFRKPLSAKEAVSYCDGFRNGPWKIVDASPAITEELWERAAQPNFAYRRIIDARLGLSLVAQGVTEFATANVKHFGDCGFKRVWNPLMEQS